jgi:lysophospholipase L1-like esterase
VQAEVLLSQTTKIAIDFGNWKVRKIKIVREFRQIGKARDRVRLKKGKGHRFAAFSAAATVAALIATISPVLNFAAQASDQAKAPLAWSGTWGASPVFPMGQEINNQTIRQFVRVSCGGSLVRVRFSNETSSQPLVIGSARLATGGQGGAIKPGTDHKLTFGGQDSITVPAGAPALSDPVDMDVPSLSTLAISIFVPRWTGLSVVHPSGGQTGYISKSGDFTRDEKIEGATPNKFRFFLTGVDVGSRQKANATIVAFGDSITDGYGSTVDTNKRWPDQLADRLNSRGASRYGVINAGISGNRLLHDAPASMFGPNGLARFDRDVLSVPGLTHVIILEGINDIGQATSFGVAEQAVSTEQLKAGLQQLIDRAHIRGVKVIGATLLPYEGTTFANYWNSSGEGQRQAINAWIRDGASLDGVIDFDKAIKDPQKPTWLKAEYDCGDHLHPNDAGYKAMADAVDLKIFD